MSGHCTEFDRAREAGLVHTPGVQDHLRQCESCALASSLHDLAQRDAATGGPALWQAIETRLDQPRWRDRLPDSVADAIRLAGAWAQPPVAAAWATGIAGVCLGLWLGAEAIGGSSEPGSVAYQETSLIEGDESGVTALFTESFAPDDDVRSGDSTGSQ